jgi:hypothetical protein
MSRPLRDAGCWQYSQKEICRFVQPDKNKKSSEFDKFLCATFVNIYEGGEKAQKMLTNSLI